MDLSTIVQTIVLDFDAAQPDDTNVRHVFSSTVPRVMTGTGGFDVDGTPTVVAFEPQLVIKWERGLDQERCGRQRARRLGGEIP